METFCVSYHTTVMMEMGRCKGVLLGLLRVCVQFKGTVIQGLQICSEWLCLRGGKRISIL